ncbi:MAG: spermidine/putrescine ABC transporter substrate-binding protein [Oscillospiraceae bacterium]
MICIGLVALIAFCTTAFAQNNTGSEYDLEYYERYKNDNISINVYNWGEYIADGSDDCMDINKEFEKLTGIKVIYTQFAKNEELYSKLKMNSVSYDVVIPSDYMIARMIKEDMLLPLNFENIPNFKYIDDLFKNPSYDAENKYSIPYTWGTVGIIYNTTMVDGEITSWDSLWDEKYANNILMFNNPRDAFGLAELKLGYSLNTEDENELKRAAQELANQKPLVQAYVMDQIFDKMQGGEAAIAPYYAGDALTMIDANPDLDFVVPKEGTNIFTDAAVIPKSAKNKEAAEMYINFLNEPKVAAENIQYIMYSSPNWAAKELLPDEIKNSDIIYPNDELISKTEYFNNLSAETNTLMDSLWTDMLSFNQSYNKWTMPVFIIGGLVFSASLIGFKKIKKKKRM